MSTIIHPFISSTPHKLHHWPSGPYFFIIFIRTKSRRRPWPGYHFLSFTPTLCRNCAEFKAILPVPPCNPFKRIFTQTNCIYVHFHPMSWMRICPTAFPFLNEKFHFHTQQSPMVSFEFFFRMVPCWYDAQCSFEQAELMKEWERSVFINWEIEIT